VNDSNNNSGNTPSKRTWLFPLGVAAIAISSIVVVSCFHDDDPPTLLSGGTDGGDNELPVVDEPPPMVVSGTGLFCDPATITEPADNDAIATYVPVQADNPPDMNISKNPTKHTGQNNLKRLSVVVPGQTPTGSLYDDNGTPDDATDDFLIGDVHPLIVSFTEQVIGGYEGGDGSADIGDPDNVDDMFTALSLDNGKTWKKFAVGETADKWSKEVTWDGVPNVKYPGHSHKPTMNIQGNNILVAWNDKYCPSGNPFGLDLDADPDADKYQVNGSQGSIDYGLDGSTPDLLAPNGKELYEVPFSCVWTARGVFGDHDGDGFHEIEWRAAQQLTTGTRDSNKIWIDSAYDAATEKGGFAITWQEDTEGLRAGKGAGPGEGYSGATTNHGTDIWYTYINMLDFDDVCAENDLLCDEAGVVDDPTVIAEYTTKPKPAVNFEYPVRITNNETCTTEAAGETKPYCFDPEDNNCIATVSVETGNDSGNTALRCVQEDLDYMTPDATIDEAAAVLDGDTGASRPALKILRTNAAEPEFIAILAYEETKGLSEQGTTTTDIDIALEGKAVYFESFPWDQPVEVSAGRVVNLRVPGATVDTDFNIAYTGLDIYENARRVVQIHQVDPCDQVDGTYTFGLIYKQGYSTQGRPSDMFIRMNTGFTYETFENTVTNVSAHDTNDDGSTDWDPTVHLIAQSYDNPIDNTFSPRAFLRGGEIYTGFEYTPNYAQHEQDNVPNNMWVHAYVDPAGQGNPAWQGPMQVSLVSGPKTSTLDPRFIPTPKGNADGVAAGLESDKSNPNVLFMSYGTLDMSTGIELDLFYTRSTDKGATWEYLDINGDPVITTAFGADGIPGTDDDPHRAAKLSAEDVVAVEEMEVQSLASPDGRMLFNAWLRETEEVCDPSPECGLDSRFGLVDYVDPATITVPE
jgi:hypothetical protein